MGITRQENPTYFADSGWHIVGDISEISYENSWTFYDTTFAYPAYRMSPDGWVYIRGLAKSGTLGTTIFTLPTAYRPKHTYYAPALAHNNVGGYLAVNSNGSVSVNSASGSNSWVWIGGRFPSWKLSAEFEDKYHMVQHTEGNWSVRSNDPLAEFPLGIWPRDTGMVELMGITGAVTTAGAQPIFPYAPLYTIMTPIADGTSTQKRLDISTKNGLNPAAATTSWSIIHGEWGLPHIEDEWIVPTLENSWVNFGFNGTNRHSIVGYWKDKYGIVHIKGVLKSGSSATATMFTLPAGYRPSMRMIFPTLANTSTTTRVDVQSNGVVSAPVGGSTTWTSLDGICFYADQ